MTCNIFSKSWFDVYFFEFLLYCCTCVYVNSQKLYVRCIIPWFQMSPLDRLSGGILGDATQDLAPLLGPGFVGPKLLTCACHIFSNGWNQTFWSQVR